MILREKLNDYRTAIGWGQLFFLAGIASSRVSHDGCLVERVGRLFADGLPASFQGFAAGLSVPFLIASIVLNLRGLTLRRQKGA
jgi:hypothetical protein